MAKATRAEREMEQILQICALRDELRTVREELDKTRANLAKADDELSSAAYDLERQGRELADARLDSARLDHVIDNFEDIDFDGWYEHCDFNAVDAADDGNEAHRIEHRKAWRKYLDAAMKEAK